MITLEDYLMGRDEKFPPSEDKIKNAEDLVERINLLEEMFGDSLKVTSGYRPNDVNSLVPNAAKNSLHETCEAVDLRDWNGILSEFILAHPSVLETLGLYMEAPESARDHVHLQTKPPKSGHRVFVA